MNSPIGGRSHSSPSLTRLAETMECGQSADHSELEETQSYSTDLSTLSPRPITPPPNQLAELEVEIILHKFQKAIAQGVAFLASSIHLGEEKKNNLEAIASSAREHVERHKCVREDNCCVIVLKREGRKVNVILPDECADGCAALFLSIRKDWRRPAASGSKKTMYFGCRVALPSNTPFRCVELLQKQGTMEAQREYGFYARVADIQGVARVHFVAKLKSRKNGKGRLAAYMDYYPGKDLFTALMEQRFGTLQKLAFAKTLCRTLQAVHARGISHNDIRKKNILLDRTLKPFLADFGLASTLSHTSAKVIGYAGYLPTDVCPAILTGEYRKSDCTLHKLRNLADFIEIRLTFAERVNTEQQAMRGKLKGELLKVRKKINQAAESRNRATKEIFRIAADNHRQKPMLLGKNDVCALGFILEEMFEKEGIKAIEELIGRMTDPDPTARIAAQAAAEILERIEQSESIAKLSSSL